jgi:GntR family histidine utilization transcriptional repressor
MPPATASTASTEGPAYRRIKSQLLARIRAGELRPGDRIPPERELMEAFECSRMTVHRAVRELADDGVVERRRRAGTRVSNPDGRNLLIDIRPTRKLVAEMGSEYGYVLLERRVQRASGLIARKLEIAVRTPVLWIKCLHTAGQRPFQLEERYVNPAVAVGIKEVDFEIDPPGDWLIDRIPWSQAEHVIAARNADSDTAAHLELPDREAILAIERTTWLEGKVVTWVRLSHPAWMYSLKTAVRT